MRIAALLVLLSACTTTIRDLPPRNVATVDQAILAGRLDFGGSHILPALHLRADDGALLRLRPRGGAFLVAVPPGRYTITRFGGYVPAEDTPRLEARRGEARYIGTLAAVRDSAGALLVVIRDDLPATQRALRNTYGASLPALAPGLVQSALAPLDPTADLAIALEPGFPDLPAYRYHGYYGRAGYGYGYAYCPPHRGRHYRRHR